MSPILASPPPDDGHERHHGRRRRKRELIEHEQELQRLATLRKKVRRAWKKLGLVFNRMQLEQEAQARWAAEKRREHEHLEKWLIHTIPTSIAVERMELYSDVELHAMRNLDEFAEVERALRTGIGFEQRWSRRKGNKRPADARLATAMLVTEGSLRGTPNALATFGRFKVSNPLLHWSTGYPWTQTVTTYGGVMAGLHSICRNTDPEVLLVANLQAIRRIRELVGDPDIGKYCAIDGMWVPAAREQRPSGSSTEEELINHGLTIAMGSHGKTWCRGWSLVVISDIKTTLPLVWLLRPANEREYTGVLDLVDMLLRLWKECPIELLAGDSEYSQHGDLSLRLESSYGVHPAFYQRGQWAKKDRWQETDGTPTCSQHGLMKLYQSDGFVTGTSGRSDRRAQGFLDGSPVRMDRARHRWFCPQCSPNPQRGDWTYTRFADNPRLYPWLPWQGGHSRVGLREALSHRRNSSESVNACLQSYGLGLPGKAGPFWCNNDADADWLAGMVIAAQSIRRLAHLSGAYARSLAEAAAMGLLTPETEADHRAWKKAHLPEIEVEEDEAA